MKFRGIHFAILTLLVLGLQLNTLGNHIVLDDRIIIAGNKSFKSWNYVGEYFTQNFCEGVDWKCSYYRPLVALSYLADHSLWGERFFGYHLTNLVIHLLVVLAIYVTFNRIFQNRVLSFFSALFFAVHPVHTESVAWISSRTDPPAGLFLLISFGFFDAFLKGRIGLNHSEKTNRHPLVFFSISLLFFIFGLLTKEIAVILPLLLFCHEWIFKGEDGASPLVSVKRGWPYLVFFGVICIYLFLRQFALGHLVLGDSNEQNLLGRLAGVPVVVWHYFSLQIFPYPLYIFRPSPNYEGWFHPEVLFSFLFFLVFLLGLFRFRRKYPEMVFGGFWFLISMLPFLIMVTLSDLRPDERYSYIPSMGISIFFGYFASQFFSPQNLFFRPRTRKNLQTALIGILIVLGLMTVVRNQDWRNEEVLWAGHYKRIPDSPEGHGNLGEIYLERGEWDLALEKYRTYTDYYPDSPLGYHFMGLIYQQMGRFDQALEQYNHALEKGTPDKLTFYNMGLIYTERKDFNRAASLFQLSISIDPSYFWSHYALGNVLKNLEDWNGSVRHYETALALQPERGDIHLSLSELYEKMGEIQKSKKHYELFLLSSQNGNIKKG